MKTTKEIISKEIIKKVVTKITTVDENAVLSLPDCIFEVELERCPVNEWKWFLRIRYYDKWVDGESIKESIIKGINNYLGEGFVKPCRNCCFGYLGFHFNDDPCSKVRVKKDVDNYIIFAESTTTKIETTYHSYCN